MAGDDPLERDALLHALGERVKELTALQACARLLLDATTPVAELLGRVAALMPPAMQYPEVTVARITHGSVVAVAGAFADPPAILASSFRTTDGVDGRIEVAYREPRGFLTEEHALLDAISDLLRVALDRRLADDALRRSNQRLDLALRSALAGVWELDLASNRVSWSPQLAALIGREGELNGAFGDFASYTHPDDRGAVLQTIRDVIAGPDARYDVEYRLLRPDGGYRRMAGALRLIRDPEGRPLRALGITTDVTARRQLEERVRHGQRVEAMGQLAAGVAHDFGNVLAVVIANGELLLHELPPDEVREVADEIVEASQHGRALVRQLMAMCRTSEFAPQAHDVNRLVLDQEPLLRRLAGPDIVLTLALDPTIGPIWIDATGFQEVAMNLVVNARDAMPDGGTITIATASGDDEDHVALTITDTGTGMPEAVVARIFEPFFTTKEAGKGTGLGLAVVASVVEQSKGRVTVESVVGRGTTFRIQLSRPRPE